MKIHDWKGNNVAVECEGCQQVFIVHAAFGNKDKQLECHGCEQVSYSYADCLEQLEINK